MARPTLPLGVPQHANDKSSRPAFGLWVPDADGRYPYDTRHSGPEVKAALDPEALSGQVPGSMIPDATDGLLYVVDTAGAPKLVAMEADRATHASQHDDGGSDPLTDLPGEAVLGGTAVTVDATAAHVTGDGSDHGDVADATAYLGAGSLAALTTTDQTGLQPAINEVDGNADAAQASADAALARYDYGTVANGAIANGTTDGKLKTVNAVDYRVAGAIYSKGATDDLWDLTAEVDTGAGEWRAYWLYVDAGGTASIAAGSTSAVSEADAIANLPALSGTDSVIGCYIAGNSCDFNGVAGLTAQGTIVNGWPAAGA